MTITTDPAATTSDAPAEFNGVPTAKMFGAIDKFTDQPELAQFRFSARNTWVEGTASTSRIHEWHGGGTDNVHVEEFAFTADHPTLGHGHGPTPQEYVLHALAACVTAGIVTGAAARGIELRSVTSTVTGDIDVRGVLGIDRDVRKGFGSVDLAVEVDADADAQQIDKLIAAGEKYSAVFDMLANPTNVTVRNAAR